MERKLFFLCAVAVLCACPARAGVFGTKTFSPQEIKEQWQLLNETDETVGWGTDSQDGIVISYTASSNIVKMKSKSQFYDVKNVTVEYALEESSDVFVIDDVMVGDVGFDNMNMEEGNPTPTEWYVPSGTRAFGNVCITTNLQKGKTRNVTIRSISITYDLEGGTRNLKWSVNEATAYIGEIFSAPVLTGNFLEGVVYSSSRPEVALVDETGQVTIVNPGETVITAAAPAQGVWKAEETSYRLMVTRSGSFVSETINIVTPGTLKDVLLDLDSRPEELVLKGKLNSADLAYISSGTGKISAVKEIDMSAVTFEYDNGKYSSIGTREGSGVGLGSTRYDYYLSEEYKIERKSTSTGLGGGNVVVSTFTNSLAGLFGSNSGLRKVILPAAMDSIGERIFFSSAVENVVLPEKIKSIPRHAFAQTTKLALINISPLIEEIGEYAFEGSSIKTLDLSKIKKIGVYSFHNSSLTGEIDLTSLDVIPAFSFCGTPITGVKFNAALKRIDSEAFASTSRLKSVKLPGNLDYIGDGAFHCENLEEMNIPASVSFIGNYALENPWKYKQPTEEGVWYFGKVAYEFDNRINGVEEISIKEGTDLVASGFSSEKLRITLKKLSFPSTLKNIGTYVYGGVDNSSKYGPFSNMEQLETVNFPEGLEVIGEGCFRNCAKLNVPEFPSTLRVIGEEAFMGCVKIAELSLPEGLEYLGPQSFQGCTDLYQVKLYSENLTSKSSPFGNNSSIETVTIGEKVGTIPTYMFAWCSGLSRIKFENPDSSGPELEFGDMAFSGCENLTFTSLPVRTVKIGDEAFNGVNFNGKLNTGNIRSIGTRAFLNSKGITELTMNENLQECGQGAFSDVSTLTTVYYYAPNLKYLKDSYYSSPFARGSNFRDACLTKVVIGANVEYIPANLFNYQPTITEIIFEPRDNDTRGGVPSLLVDEYAFRQCSMVREVIMPECRTAIGALAFYDCSGMTSLRLGNGTENIDESAFERCGKLASVDVPPTVISIGAKAFYSSGISPNVYFHTQEPPVLGNLAVNRQSVITVPQTAETAYRQTVLSDNPFRTYTITSFALDKDIVSLNAGENIKLEATYAPSDFSGLDIKWVSSNPEVAQVDMSGNVTSLSVGEALITASPAYVPGFSANCTIKVNEGSGIEEPKNDGSYIEVIVSDGRIEILNACNESLVCLYAIDGRLLYYGSDKVIDSLEKGVYIVSCEGHSRKVQVR